MKLTPRTLLVLADGSKAVFLCNQGHNGRVRLKELQTFSQNNPASRDLGWDRPGRTYARYGFRRSAYETHDPHDLGEGTFLKDLAQAIEGALGADGYERVVLMAPPEALGQLRQALGPVAKDKVDGTIAKDYLNMPRTELEQILMRGLQ